MTESCDGKCGYSDCEPFTDAEESRGHAPDPDDERNVVLRAPQYNSRNEDPVW